jgi:hypothetical protein
MATHDYVIDNQSASAFRSDLNNALQAIVTQNSSATAPTTTYANMIWYDTAANQLKKRNEANSAWIVLGTIDEALSTFTPSGERALASQAQAEAGTDNTTVMTPLRTAQAIAALASSGYTTAQVFDSSGTFVTPAGITEAFVIVVGGGGGGGGTSTTADGGSGGFGGLAVGTIAVSGSITVTVGAGGAGTNSAATGGSGGTSSFSTLSATGGAGGASGNSGGASGANGVGTGGIALNSNADSGAFAASFPGAEDALKAFLKPSFRSSAVSSTAALAFSLGGNFRPGAAGDGETDSAANDATGGVGGAVIVCY